MAIVRGISTTISVNVDGQRLEKNTAYVTLEQDDVLITKNSAELEFTDIVDGTETTGTNVKVYLSAEETQKLTVGGVQFQIRWEDADGNVSGSKVVQIPVGGSLKSGKE